LRKKSSPWRTPLPSSKSRNNGKRYKSSTAVSPKAAMKWRKWFPQPGPTNDQ
jgi:hypothetical protein